MTLVGQWQDQSVQVLLPLDLPTKGANLVVARDALPLGMALPDYVAEQQHKFRRDLTGYTPIQDTAGTIDQRPVHFSEFTWESEGRKVHQIMMVVQGPEKLLQFTGSIPGTMDDETRRTLLTAMRTFRFANSDGAIVDKGRS